ncbi:hypothetical protein BT67DRAFT_77240 [Trichocladium antarcticum]|uniref:Uncharacterized protein n=1 Tax=Trichocladium antarcticum TaxID=1450529 RepID=A0AAN6ZCH0_9PEZI|nr:hypothetical protein BT67DRAFT_77240 [Trichocladium antarcticum]
MCGQSQSLTWRPSAPTREFLSVELTPRAQTGCRQLKIPTMVHSCCPRSRLGRRCNRVPQPELPNQQPHVRPKTGSRPLPTGGISRGSVLSKTI